MMVVAKVVLMSDNLSPGVGQSFIVCAFSAIKNRATDRHSGYKKTSLTLDNSDLSVAIRKYVKHSVDGQRDDVYSVSNRTPDNFVLYRDFVH